ncbi:MAG: DUF1963 domain-containing protein [Roseobacter sp.]
MGLLKRQPKDGKQVSVILKRQVPIRFDEKASSWLGGLPMMPELVKWPRDVVGAPLHFVAQISCADLPADLWNGQGPRTGWLLFFIESIKFEDEAGSDLVRVLHITELGPEREPPDDMPTVRHTMSDYIDYAKPNIRPGVPKLWRKWPIDLVTQTYGMDSDDEGFVPPSVSGEDLYSAPVSKRGFYGRNNFGIERPLTWRGALYYLEGVMRDLNASDFKRKFVGLSGLLGAPEADQDEFNEELRQRIEANPACADRDVGWGPRVGVVTEKIKSELRAERSKGWMKRSYVALDKKLARHEHWLAAYQADFDAGLNTLEDKVLKRLEEKAKDQLKLIEETNETRAYLDELFASYPGADGEQKFNAEIKAMGEAHLAWGEEMGARAKSCLKNVRSKNLDDPISTTDWQSIREQFSEAKSVFWLKAESRVLAKVERGLSTDLHLHMAIREDLLDLYTRDANGLQALSQEQRDAFEHRLRYIEENLPHRIGGHANPVQGGTMPGHQLVIQLATDKPMGWMWGDVGAIYVMMKPKDLKSMRFKNLYATLEGH